MGLSRGLGRVGLTCALGLGMRLTTFVNCLKAAAPEAQSWHGAYWLSSLREELDLDRETFEDLAWRAHQADLIELSRADLVEAMPADLVAESELTRFGARFHFVRFA